jgi:hypothetical protein
MLAHHGDVSPNSMLPATRPAQPASKRVASRESDPRLALIA